MGRNKGSKDKKPRATYPHKRGEESHRWKGDNVNYGGLHQWVSKNRIKPKKCFHCRKEGDIEWANKSRKYKRDLKDWIPLCTKCHTIYDLRGKKIEKKTYQYDMRGNLIKIWDSVTKAAEGTGFSKGTISHAITYKRKNYHRDTKFIWKH